MIARRLLDDYNFYRRHTRNMAAVAARKNFLPPDLSPKPEHLRALELMAIWCVERGFDPHLWLYTLFVARSWMYPPRFDALTPKSHVARYHAASKLGWYESRQRATRGRARAQAGATYDPNRDVAAAVEVLKAERLRVGGPQACMDATREETLGFHPASAVCVPCPIKQACAEQLMTMVPFDIMALRHGAITAEQAQAQAQRHWDQQLQDAAQRKRWGNG